MLFPRPSGPWLEAVLLNTAGGWTGGDRSDTEAETVARARLCLTSQACERAYRSAGGAAEVGVRLRVGEGGRIDWLPQETILYDGAALRRRLEADVAAGGTLMVAEALLFGRLAHGEQVRRLSLRDRWTVRREGELVFADALRIEGDAAALLDGPAGGGARAAASFLLVGSGAEAALERVRPLLPPKGGAGVVREGVLFGRLLAADGHALRRALIPLILALAEAPLPKVWRL
ncbi:urease accessory protein UreD [Rubellimicrobium sp. CFH 75288]|uniref:urease accessory protein UreD n=1 Tax=Rubellimicrobium sp. CFH 75288 TaxID=2697034 RepID=UPI0014131AE3|nr:urease accessory protein UreD [Rubellimicrobium sp. CFH 75288]NAZ36225.1 urease accessory protein UreD [Rubellimicrobium sp. CFH 75288]